MTLVTLSSQLSLLIKLKSGGVSGQFSVVIQYQGEVVSSDNLEWDGTYQLAVVVS